MYYVYYVADSKRSLKVDQLDNHHNNNIGQVSHFN